MGYRHMLMLTKSGEVFCSGKNNNYECAQYSL